MSTAKTSSKSSPKADEARSAEPGRDGGAEPEAPASRLAGTSSLLWSIPAGGGRSNSTPQMPAAPAEPPSEEDLRESLIDLRRFHHQGPFPGEARTSRLENVIPAHLHRYRDPDRIRYDYPLFLRPARTETEELICRPVSEVLEEACEACEPVDPRVLRDNLPRVERILREAFGDRPGPQPAPTVFDEVGKCLLAELQLKSDIAERLAGDYRKMIAAVPEGGKLLGFDESATLHLLRIATRSKLLPRRESFRREVEGLCARLDQLLRIDRGKGEGSRRPGALQAEVGPAGAQYVDPAALASIVGPHRGSPPMEAGRRRRIEEALNTLEAWSMMQPGPDVTLVHGGTLDTANLEPDSGWAAVSEKDPCAAAVTLFDRNAAALAPVFRAARIARLEVENAYDPSRHDPWLEDLSWESFTEAELLLVPAVAALEPPERLAGDRMRSLSRLLLSGRPVQVVVPLLPADNPGDPGEDPLAGFRLELGYLGIGHREALIHQSTAARPLHLLEGFLRSRDLTRASMHVVASDVVPETYPTGVGSWLAIGAALEGRAHPLFLYNPQAGASWARRLDFSGNPQPEADWPVYPLEYKKEGGEEAELPLAFTFCDFLLLDPAFHPHFRPVPAKCDGCEDLVALDAYLTMDDEEAEHRLPFIWGVDGEGMLIRLAITRRMALACRDRLDFWRTLQELAGVRNEYVLEAIRKAREEAETEAKAERKKLEEEHAAEVERVRDEAAGRAMEGLARMLLEIDPGLELGGEGVISTSAIQRPGAGTATPPAGVPAPGAPPAAETGSGAGGDSDSATAVAEPVEEEVSFDEPWIDTPLCTSCNDCTAINPLVFVYDANKQARIGDAKAGTYAQLVAAAEKCPAHCIHPGKPLNPDEPNLEELIQRAEPFN